MIVIPAVRRILTAVESAEHTVTRGLGVGLIETEPSLTDRFLGALDNAFGTEIESDGYYLSVRTLRDRGPNAPEREFGADVVSVLRVDTSNFQIAKGFLGQAKMAGRGGVSVKFLNHRDLPEISIRRPSRDEEDPKSLYSQCRQMLAVTPDSYVLVYAPNGIYVVPASSIASLANDGQAHRVYMKLLRWFMADFVNSFIGDLRVSAYDDASLRRARDINLANYAMMFQIQDAEARRRAL